MKRYAWLILPILLLVAIGCSDSTSEPNADAEYMSASVEGQNWTAEEVSINDVSSGLEIRGVSIIGSGGVIAFGGVFNGPGTYNFGELTPHLATYTEVPNLGSPKVFLASSGSVTFSKLDDEGATGTFAFEAVEQGNDPGTTPETRSVTSGEFNVRY